MNGPDIGRPPRQSLYRTPLRPPRRRRGQRVANVLRALLGVALTLVTLPVAFSLAVPLLLIGQEVTAPSWVTRTVEAQAGELFSGGEIDFGAITLTVGTDLHPRVGLRDTILRDASGAELARVSQVEALISPRGLLFNREVLAQEVVLRDAEIGLRRDTDGRVAVSFDRDPAPEIVLDDRRATGLAGLLQQIDLIFERPALAALEQVRAEGLVINYEDARARRSWIADDGRLALDLRSGDTSLSGGLSLLSGRDYVTMLAFGYDREAGSDWADLTLKVDDVASRDIASQHPALSFLSVLDAPLSAALKGRVGHDGRPGPFNAALQIGKGALAPGPDDGDGIGFDSAALYLSFDPAKQRVAFDRIAVDSDWGQVAGSGKAWLREIENGWPEALVGQLALSQLDLNPGGILPEPVELRDTWIDLRLRTNPFGIEVGGFGLTDAESNARFEGSGQVGHSSEGWSVALDAKLDRLPSDRLVALWPVGFKPGTRDWVATNILDGTMTDITAGLRIAPDTTQNFAMTLNYEEARVQAMRDLPPIENASGHVTLGDGMFSVTVAEGGTEAPEAGHVSLSGSSFTIPELGGPRPPARIRLEAEGAVTAMLSLVDQPPFRFLQRAGQPVDLIDGQGRASARIALPLGGNLVPDEIDYAVTGRLFDVSSDKLVPNRNVTADALDLSVTKEALTVAGPVTIGTVPADVTFRQPLGGRGEPATVTGEVELSQRFLDEFAIALPENSISGRGRGRVRLTLAAGAPPSLTMSTDLAGLGLSIPPLDWSLARGTTGALEIAGTLGQPPRIDRFALDAGGLSARGAITLRPEGGLDRVSFERVRLNGWLDVAATLVGRGAGRLVGIEIASGALDLRRAEFGKGSDGSEGGPISVALDQLRVTDAVALTNLRGDFSSEGGFSGRFTAAVNGGAPISGLVVPDRGRAAVRISGKDAGAVLRSAGLYGSATGGALDLMLLPTGASSTYEGDLLVRGLRVQEAPAIAQLLDAISVVGLLQQLDGQGLAFDRIAAKFRLTPDILSITESSASGPGLGISLDGLYRLASRQMDFQGVVSPFYLVNSIGSILTRPGEGLIGFNYRLTGTPDDPQVSVNPLSALTPGMFREIFRRAPPTNQEARP